jgi:acylphosphatase
MRQARPRVLLTRTRSREEKAKGGFHMKHVSGSLSRARFSAIFGPVWAGLAPAEEHNVPDELSARRFFVSGVVQGVGYRFFAQRAAKRLGVAGYARNLRDGRVEVFAVAREDVLEDFRTELRRGPASASVSHVEVEEAEVGPRFSTEFSIEYSD